MSGGVDSSVAALLLKEEGYEVHGVTMRLWRDPGSVRAATDEGNLTPDPGEEAAKVAAAMGIPHRVVDLQDAFYNRVVCNFTGEYSRGRTPNPCVDCNRSIKFGLLFEEAVTLGFDKLATGHYVRIAQDHPGGKFRLLKGLDPGKDQSYMLYVLGQQQLKMLLFPLGEKSKAEVRAIAEQHNLAVADKEESQEVCFIPDNDYRSFIERSCPQAAMPGFIVSGDGKVLGRHRGIAFYTIGQRKGLGLTTAEPYYVVSIIADENKIVVGPLEGVFSSGLVAGKLNYIGGTPPLDSLEIEVKIRYRAPVVTATLVPFPDGTARVFFKEKQKAVSPGQSAVFYRGEEVLGGGVIESAL